jgi:hypothetical protein
MLKIIFLSAFFLFFLVDFLINNYTGFKSTQIKNYYKKFLNLHIFSIFTLLFLLFLILFYLLSLLFPSLFDIELYTYPIDFSVDFEFKVPFSKFYKFLEDQFIVHNLGSETANVSNTESNTSGTKINIDSSGKSLSSNVSVNNANLNSPQFNISVPASGLNNMASALTATGGAAAAAKVAQNLPAFTIVKAAAGAGTIILTGTV